MGGGVQIISYTVLVGLNEVFLAGYNGCWGMVFPAVHH